MNGALWFFRYIEISSSSMSSSRISFLLAMGSNLGLNRYDSNGGYLILSSITSLGIKSPM
ncbi:MAG: hypothetical protein ACJZ5B_00810 [Candidatus Poseidoniaceae archaeon]